MYRKRILAYTEIIDYKVYMNCKYRFRVISGSHILHLPVKSVIVGIKIHYIFDISFKSFHCLFLLSLSYGCIIKQVNREFMPNRKKKQTNLAKKGFMKNNQIFTNAAYLTFIVSALFFFVGVFLSESLVRILGADVKVMLLFAPAFFTNNLLQCFVRNDGNPALSMAAMITGSISNVILDYIFIFPLSMGIFGSIFATGLSPIISIIVLSPYSHFIKK